MKDAVACAFHFCAYIMPRMLLQTKESLAEAVLIAKGAQHRIQSPFARRFVFIAE